MTAHGHKNLASFLLPKQAKLVNKNYSKVLGHTQHSPKKSNKEFHKDSAIEQCKLDVEHWLLFSLSTSVGCSFIIGNMLYNYVVCLYSYKMCFVVSLRGQIVFVLYLHSLLNEQLANFLFNLWYPAYFSSQSSCMALTFLWTITFQLTYSNIPQMFSRCTCRFLPGVRYYTGRRIFIRQLPPVCKFFPDPYILCKTFPFLRKINLEGDLFMI